jgi:hypothetical protein
MFPELLLAVLTAVLAALLASACTLGAAWWLWERRLRPRVEADFEARLAAVRAEMGETIRERVRQGILDGVAAIPSLDVVRGAQKTVADAAVELVRGGLSSLLGGPGRPRGGGSGGEGG